jgi:hypothetical protein
MTKASDRTGKKSQVEKFRQASREAGTDDDEKRFDERLKEIARKKPADDSNSEPKEPRS